MNVSEGAGAAVAATAAAGSLTVLVVTPQKQVIDNDFGVETAAPTLETSSGAVVAHIYPDAPHGRHSGRFSQDLMFPYAGEGVAPSVNESGAAVVRFRGVVDQKISMTVH